LVLYHYKVGAGCPNGSFAINCAREGFRVVITANTPCSDVSLSPTRLKVPPRVLVDMKRKNIFLWREGGGGGEANKYKMCKAILARTTTEYNAVMLVKEINVKTLVSGDKQGKIVLYTLDPEDVYHLSELSDKIEVWVTLSQKK